MNAQKPDALRLADALAYCDSSVASQAARELLRLHAENAALQQGYDAVQAAHADVAGQCEDAIELLGKYKELCEEIKRGDSYHIGRIDAAISVLAQAAPHPSPTPQADSQPAPVLGTIAHVGTGKTTLTGAITSALRAASTEADNVTAPAGGAVVTDDMVLAALRMQYPGAYGQYLRHPANGPKTSLRTESEIDTARRMIVAALSAAPIPPTQAQSGAVPLTDEQIVGVMHSIPINAAPSYHIAFARAIEAGHGIQGGHHDIE